MNKGRAVFRAVSMAEAGLEGGKGMSAVKVVMIDNYDSFTYNLVQYFGELGRRCDGGAQRRSHVEQIAEFASRQNRHFPRPLHAERSRHFGRNHSQSMPENFRSLASVWAIKA